MPVYKIQGPSGEVFQVEGDSPPTEQELEQIYAALSPSDPTQSPTAAAPNPRAQRAAEQQAKRQELNSLMTQFESGKLSSRDMTPEQRRAVESERIARLPEIAETGLQNLIGGDGLDGILTAMAGMTTFDPAEFADILQTQHPQIGITQTKDGEMIAVNNETGAVANINRAGPSLMDALQIGAAASLFSAPVIGATRAAGTSALARAGAEGAVSAGLQSGIEAGQSAMGGQFNPSDIALAGAAAPATMAVGRALKSTAARMNVGKKRTKAVDQYFSDAASEVAQAPKIDFESDPTILKGAYNSPQQVQLKQYIRDGDVRGVGYKIKNGRVVKDDIARKLVNEGVSEKLVIAPNSMTPGDRQAANEMMDLAFDFLTKGKGSEKSRPNKVIGKNTIKRLNFLREKKRGAGERIGNAVKKDFAGNKIIIDDLRQAFASDLSDLQIYIDEKGLLDDSVALTDQGINQIKKSLSFLNNTKGDARALHTVKQSLSNLINYDDKSIVREPIHYQIESAISNLRENINRRLRSMSPDYAKANDEFSEIAGVIKPFVKSVGRLFDPSSDRAENYIGQEARKVLTNYSRANPMIEAFDNLETMVAKYGAKYDDDIMTQVMVNNAMEDVFGSFVPGGSQSLLERGARGAIQSSGIMGEAADMVIDKVKDKVVFTPPTKQKLETLQLLRKHMREN